MMKLKITVLSVSFIAACIALGQNTFAPEDVIDLEFTIGDSSASHSERWLMNIAGGPTTLRAQSPDYGKIGTANFNQFRKGKAYSITVEHQGTHPQYIASTQDSSRETLFNGSSWYGSDAPDYDYKALVEVSTSVGYLVKDEAQPPLLGTSNGNETNEASGKTAYIAFPKPILSFTDYTEEQVAGDPGVLVMVNDNDSNEDGAIDSGSPYPEDPDYVEILLEVELSGAVTVDEGVMRLSANTNDLRVRDPDDSLAAQTFPIEWDMSTEDGDPFRSNGKKLLLEAMAPSDEYKDVTLTFEYVNNGSTSDEAELTLLKVEFETFPDDVSGPDKAHKINLSTRQNEAAVYGDFEKSVSHIWESSQTVDLIDYLADADDPSMRTAFETALEWKANGQALTGYELNYGSNPNSDEIERFDIEVLAKGSSAVIDRLILVIVPPETFQQFNDWYTAEADTGWLNELPALYWRFSFEQEGTINPVLVPVDPEPSDCAEQRWGDFGDSDTYYHPDGYYKARSEKTQNGHGHQAIYTQNAIVIKSGVSAGSADRQAPFPSNLNPFLHVNADVKPFIWAAQLDGNPVEENGTTMTAPMLHEGANLQRYFERRPAVANGLSDLVPGQCGQ